MSSQPAADPLTPRRQQLMSAAMAVVASSGLRGLTHRAVDHRAGLPQGSCSAYYRTRQALLAGLAQSVFDQLQTDVAELSAHLAENKGCHPDDAEYAAGRIAQTFLAWLRAPELLIARLELTLEGVRTPELGAAIGRFRQQLVDVVEESLTAHDDPRVQAPIVVAALDGVLLAALQRPEATRQAFLQDSLPQLMRALREG